eukprot:1366752-Amphidinium_carterae.1
MKAWCGSNQKSMRAEVGVPVGSYREEGERIGYAATGSWSGLCGRQPPHATSLKFRELVERALGDNLDEGGPAVLDGHVRC